MATLNSPLPHLPSHQDGLPPAQRRKAVLVILLGLVLVVLDGSIATLALPRIAAAMDVSAADAVWVITGYQLAVLGLLLPMASLGERIGYHRVYLHGMVVFGVASLLCALSQTLWQLVVFRTVQGLAGAAVMGVNAALVRQVYPLGLLGRGIALNAMVVAVASVAGPSLAAVILSALSWPWLFGLNVPLVALTVWLGWRCLPPSEAHGQTHIVLLDVILNILAFGLFFWAFDGLSTRGFADWRLTSQGVNSLAALLVSLFLWGWYVRRQWHLAAPLLPLDLLRMPVFALSMCSSVMAFSAQMLTFIALPFLCLTILHQTPLQAGLVVSVWPVAIVLMAPLAGRLIGRYSGAVLGGIGMAMLTLGSLLLALLSPADASPWQLAWRLALCGLGFGLFQSPNNHVILTTGPRERAGAAGGMLGTGRLTGQSLGAALAAGVFALWPPTLAPQGPQVAFALAAGCALLAGIASSLRAPAAARS
ncbi:MFS transporter [Corticibacter populi]|uniref:MFS transporter n=1 Tax=Corticibacter populi TaxID=1550736 RepID=A0A3M6QL46_9BURK|nr:MFS transporter [Corticibacter populi]RMX03451.1 MFS transporter [Corticibacter populi]RZS29888.1 DHA2 family multidrug resistance protein-like MFS transporter [Corticibacter populi]